ncbi:MAG: hypothetical protein AWU57_854 [Marinobacter sp. T13-3]|jgi:protein-S-isoprenylcysteine O-methyltransferase Ste14|nr:MAG: hypothetical protein AWU57_854 [Marinobacter sp. T13-3]
MNNLELKIPPVLLVAITVAVMWVLSQISPELSFTISAAALWASGLALLGIGIAVSGVLAFRTAGTTVDPRVPEQSEALVVRGIYRFSRNPMYLGFLLVLAAWCLYLGSVLSLLCLPLFVLYMNRFQIVPEERFMREKFGEVYRLYEAGVRRWV